MEELRAMVRDIRAKVAAGAKGRIDVVERVERVVEVLEHLGGDAEVTRWQDRVRLASIAKDELRD
jgi:hypothetical protein